MLTGLPAWDLASALDTGEPDLDVELKALTDEIELLARLYDQHSIDAGPPIAPDHSVLDVFDRLLTRTDAAARRSRLLSLYHAGRCWAGGEHLERDSNTYLRVQQQLSPAAALHSRLEAWVARIPFEWLTSNSPLAADHRLWLQRCRTDRAHQLPRPEEELLSQLDTAAAATAWIRLYEDSCARLTSGTGASRIPVTLLTAASAPTPFSRAQIHEEAGAAWTGMAPIAAACLNAILGQEWLVAKRRGWVDLLEARLHREGISPGTLHLTHDAVEDLLPELHRFAKAKAQRAGTKALPFWEISAPLPGEHRWSWTEATDLIVTALTECDPELGKLATTAAGHQWIDAEPRSGKRAAALCLPMRDRESRIMLNFDGSASAILRLAHEMGHAYHHAAQAGQTERQRSSPLFLRETASMVAEQAVINATFLTPSERIFLLGAWLGRTFRTCATGLARFRFEQAAVHRRRSRHLTIDELNALAIDSQNAVYGDAIAQQTMPAHMWISEAQLYSSRFNSISYHLARLAAAAAFPAGPATHLAAFLAGTGTADPAALFAGHGHDLHDAAFWQAGVKTIGAQVDLFAAAPTPVMLPASPPSGDPGDLDS